MAQNYIQEGDRYEHVVAGSAVTSGALVTVGDMVGVALAAGAVGATVVVALEGVFEVPKATGSGTGLTVGTTVYRDGSNNRVTATATNNKAVGRVWKAAATTDATVEVKLCCLPAGPTA